MDNKNNARLGKGLSSIFGQDVSKVLDDIQNGDMEVERQEQSKIPVDEIRPNPYQPRKVFNDEALKEFSDKIKNDEDVIIDIEIHTMADEITKWYEVVLCKDIQLKFAKDGFIDIYNNNISKYVCIDNEERVQ